ncbi:MAG: NAD(P)H-quinone oxidoreductase [Hyphomonadaceae bacterium]
MMRAIAHEKGAPLKLVETPKPVLRPGEILIRVRAVGVNRADLVQRAGFYPPPPGASEILGLEVSGEVEALGEGATRWMKGDKVCALLAGGGYAEYVAVDEGSVLPIPSQTSLVDAAAIPEAAITVWANVFETCALMPGEAFLIHGGASGIGTTAIQMAAAHGAKVYATAGDDAKLRLCETLGAKRAINYKTEDFEAVLKAEGGVDVILDMAAGPYLQKNINIMNERARLAHIAFLLGPRTEIDLTRVMLKRLTITGSTIRSRAVAEKARLAREVERQVWPWIEAGQLKPVIDSVYPIEEAEDAHKRMQAGAHAGKIVLTFD